MFCARLFICALWSPAGKGLTSWLSFVVSSVSLSLSHWYPGSGVVLDCIDSWSLHHYLLLIRSYFINPYKPSVIFVGHRQTVQNQIRRHRTWRLIRFCTACIQNILLKYEWKWNLPPNNPYSRQCVVSLVLYWFNSGRVSSWLNSCCLGYKASAHTNFNSVNK